MRMYLFIYIREFDLEVNIHTFKISGLAVVSRYYPVTLSLLFQFPRNALEDLEC